MNDVRLTEEGIRIGPALTFTDLRDILKELSEKLTDEKKRYFPAILYLVRHYGADQIRNLATLGGSLINSRSNYDLPTLLAAVGASIEITSVNETRTVKYNGNLDLAPEEIITSIILPYSTEDEYLEFFKVAGRRTFSLCTGNGGLFVKFSKGSNTVESFRLCFGGFGGSMITADKSAEKATGREFNEVLLSDLLSSISEELQAKAAGTKSDPDYHVKLASGFLFKFYISVLTQRNGLSTPEETGSAIEPLTKIPYESTQIYENVPGDQELTDAVGRPVPSVSSQGMVSGEAIYIDDMPKFENELIIGLVTSSRCHATITDVDVSRALQMPGVRGFIDHRDVPGDNHWGPLLPDEEVFASKEVTYVGCVIGAIVADTREHVKLATKAVTIKYKDLDAVVSIQDAIKKESFYPFQEELVAGDVIEGFRLSDHVIEGEFETGRQEHFYMETQSTIAVPRTENNEMEVFVGTQDLTSTQSSLSKILRVPFNKIVVRTKRLGGSFGGKVTSQLHASGPAVVAAYKLRRPIRCILSREDDMLITGKRHAYYVKYKAGFDNSGKIKAVEAELYADGGHSVDYTPMVLEHTMLLFESTYKISNLKLNGRVCKTNTATGTAMRGFGNVQAAVMMEEIIFRISIALQVSQAQVRHVNHLKEGDVLSYGMSLKNCTIGECWDKCAMDSRFEARVQAVQQFNKQNRWKKRGVTMTSCRFGIGFPKRFMMQVASRALGAPMEKIFINETSTQTVPNTMATGGSTGADICGPAVIDACTKLKERLAPFKDKIPDGNWERWVLAAYFERVQLSVTGFYKAKKDADFDLKKKTGQPSDYFTYGVACSEVELDCLTGESQVLQTDIVMDVGKSLNPTIDIGQIEGAFIQGLGMMTSEKVITADDGRMVNCSPLSYKIPNVSGIPRKFNVTLLKNENAVTHLYSSKGIGEPSLLLATSVFMAIKAAIQEARQEIGLSGYFRLDCPATVEQIRLACGDQLVGTMTSENRSCYHDIEVHYRGIRVYILVYYMTSNITRVKLYKAIHSGSYLTETKELFFLDLLL
ncbi:hypothetical protein ACJMK2_022334 [Sinanodonta woodiana]|uniref:FAD-binding PCMH-type domain-containing protein n=1 Tax=Sinanodonta woodiana TaxID=1069815 RepID=A0ABD3TLD3_SINWO